MPTTRRRDLPSKTGKGRLEVETRWVSDGELLRKQNFTGDIPVLPNGTQVTASESHPLWRTRKRGGNTSDIGGDFSTVKTFARWKSSSRLDRTVAGGTFSNRYLYTGPLLCSALPGVAFPPSIQSGDTTLDAWGAKAIASAKPTNALVDLSTTLGEILGPGGIPRIFARSEAWRKNLEGLLKGSSDEYLNVEFGWKPLLSDIGGFAIGVQNFHALIKQYERDAGKVVRRRWDFEPETHTDWSTYSSGLIPFINPTNDEIFGSVRGDVQLSRQTQVRRWFSGAFTYHLPTGYSSRSKLLSFGPEAQKLLGVSPTPETLWNLSPWSWAVDWFSSAGDVVSNISDWSTDGLVMRYGYIMEHSLSRDTYRWVGPRVLGHYPAPVTLARESKVRRKANPFGFGLTWEGLSPRQAAIAAALGITRS